MIRRSPHGERGLKLQLCQLVQRQRQSLPPRGAWIEITIRPERPSAWWGRSPHGERGLKSGVAGKDVVLILRSLPPRGAWIEIAFPGLCCLEAIRRSPHGERGLKWYNGWRQELLRKMSLPPRGAWIEILAGNAWNHLGKRSLPPRGAWIEIPEPETMVQPRTVAPPTGSVD